MERGSGAGPVLLGAATAAGARLPRRVPPQPPPSAPVGAAQARGGGGAIAGAAVLRRAETCGGKGRRVRHAGRSQAGRSSQWLPAQRATPLQSVAPVPQQPAAAHRRAHRGGAGHACHGGLAEAEPGLAAQAAGGDGARHLAVGGGGLQRQPAAGAAWEKRFRMTPGQQRRASPRLSGPTTLTATQLRSEAETRPNPCLHWMQRPASSQPLASQFLPAHGRQRLVAASRKKGWAVTVVVGVAQGSALACWPQPQSPPPRRRPQPSEAPQARPPGRAHCVETAGVEQAMAFGSVHCGGRCGGVGAGCQSGCACLMGAAGRIAGLLPPGT